MKVERKIQISLKTLNPLVVIKDVESFNFE